MLCHPNAAIAPGLGMDREIPGVVERATRIGGFGDADEIEDRQRRHTNSPNETICVKDVARDTAWSELV
jgi:hypothetical protein